MGQLALMAIGTGISFISSMQQASAQEDYGKAQQDIANRQAENARVIAERNAVIRSDEAKYAGARGREQAVQEEAVALKRARETRRQTDQRVSGARAAAGASGGGGSSVFDLIDDIVETGELNAGMDLFEGRSRASLLRSEAGLVEYEGTRDAEMIRYGGATDSSLIRSQGSLARFDSNIKASATRSSAYADLFSGGMDISSKYKPKAETIRWNQGGSSYWYR